MFIMPVGVSSCPKNGNFRAHLGSETLKNIFSNSNLNYEQAISNVNTKIEELKTFGGSDTVVEIGAVETETHTMGEYYSDGFFGWSNGHPDGPDDCNDIVSEDHYVTYHFTNPLLQDAVSFTKISLNNDAMDSLDAGVVATGESKLLSDFADKFVEKHKSAAGSLFESAKDLIAKLQTSNFNKNAIEKFTEYLSALDKRKALDKTIETLKRTI